MKEAITFFIYFISTILKAIRPSAIKSIIAELAKKHWIDGWSVQQLGDKWGYKRTSINAYLRRLRRGEIESIELELEYREAIIKEARNEQEKIMEYLKSKGRSSAPRGV